MNGSGEPSSMVQTRAVPLADGRREVCDDSAAARKRSAALLTSGYYTLTSRGLSSGPGNLPRFATGLPLTIFRSIVISRCAPLVM